MPELSILITHYNRPDSLKKCIAALRAIDFPFKYEIVVSDDCSKLENLQRIQSFSIDKLITSEFNSGLANNINRGIKNCSGKYLMYVQEDHLAKKELEEHIEECISILEEDRLDMIRLKANFRFKYLRLISEHFAEIPRLHIRNFYLNFFTYSDHPFIVKGDFYQKFGYYLKNSSGHYGELEYGMRVLKLRVRVGIIKNYVFQVDKEAVSVLNYNEKGKRRKWNKNKFKKNIQRFLRVIKHSIVYLFYSPKKRELILYKNKFYLKHSSKPIE